MTITISHTALLGVLLLGSAFGASFEAAIVALAYVCR